MPETVLSRSILLSWQPPAYQDRNGIITGYVIELSRSQEILTFQTENKTLLIDERVIKPFTQYTCRIAASTTPGVGPYSEQIRIYTPEDGEILEHSVLYNCSVHFSIQRVRP